MAPTTCSSLLVAVGSVSLLIALQGCDELSDVGNQPTRAPHAIATAIGYAASDASGDVSINVRSQAEVLLSGGNSVESDAPILTFLWEPQNDAARSAAVTIRNLNTINVAIPAVTAPTDLIFRLTVRESDGDADTATATLHAQPALDSNRFLTLVGRTASLRVVAATLQPIAAGGDFELRLKSRVSYTTRSGARNSVEFDLGSPVQGQWPSNVGSGGDSATDFRNPVFDFAVPSFNADDVTRLFQATLPDSSGSLPDPGFVDDTDIEVVASLSSPTLQEEAVLYVLDAGRDVRDVVARQANGNNGLPTELTLTPEQVEALRISGGGLENKDTARAYYEAIDPGGEKTTLRAWLTANCFDPDAGDFRADAHAIYTNNFDLGFGRDMYFRTARPANCTSASFGPGDAASVVINYPSLEAAAKKINPIIAVAMEYKATDPARSQPGRVTFYAFAPDEGTGEFRRVLSANFDGRGEKYLPGSCTACHGGRPLTPPADPRNTYALSSDVGATFMPWDLESFLYSDTDPAFPTDAANASLRSQFTRALQEAEFKKLNAAAYETFGGGQPFQCHAAFGGPCELVEIWYGGAGLPSATFRDGEIAAGWLRGGPDNNPPEAEQVYLDAFARHCRACHVQRVQDPTGGDDPQFRTYAELLAEGDSVKALTFNEGAMPAARLTMDRFWIAETGSASAGELLAQNLDVPAPAAPGRPLACVSSEAGPALSPDSASRTAIARNDPVSESAACSQFVQAFTWELTVPTGSTAALVGADTARASFSPDEAGDYDLTLRVAGFDGVTESSTNRFAVVSNIQPVALTLNASSTFNVNPPTAGAPVEVGVFAPPNNPGDAPATVTFFNPTNLTFVQGVEGLVTITPTSTSSGSLGYTITDIDGDTATNTVQLAVQPAGSLVANDDLASAVAANSSVPSVINILANDFTADLNVTVTASPTGTCQGRLSTRATVTVNSDQTISYLPPLALVTGPAYDGPTGGCTSVDTFTYTIQSPPLTPATGTVRVPVSGTRFFSQVSGIIGNTCAGSACHSSSQTGANWAIGSTPTETYNQLRNNAPDGDDGVFIDLREVESAGDTSLLLRKPLGQVPHTGGVVLSPAEAAIIRTWLEEGAYNN